ncbi:hypothetical protein EON83_22210 [bacterium]|nr:MAG: hypothetical protein EON83_22210 [bacterium]
MKNLQIKSYRQIGAVLGFLGAFGLGLTLAQPASAQEPTLDVRMQLQRIKCIDEGDGIGSAEPYLWAVFFKIDGEKCVVNSAFQLDGRAQIKTTFGNHENLPNHDVDDGEVINIPASLGADYRTRLVPLPLSQPIAGMTNTAAAMGCIVVLMEEDNTPNSAVASGHLALNHAVEEELNRLIPTLGIAKRSPTEQDIKDMKSRIGAAVKKAIKDKVTVGSWLLGAGNMDDQIGSEVFLFSTSDLKNVGTAGIPIEKQWNNEGKWKLEGNISVTPARRIVPRRTFETIR